MTLEVNQVEVERNGRSLLVGHEEVRVGDVCHFRGQRWFIDTRLIAFRDLLPAAGKSAVVFRYRGVWYRKIDSRTRHAAAKLVPNAPFAERTEEVSFFQPEMLVGELHSKRLL